MAVECVSASSSLDVLTYTDKLVSKSRHMLEILTEFKINDESSDRVTVDVNAINKGKVINKIKLSGTALRS